MFDLLKSIPSIHTIQKQEYFKKIMLKNKMSFETTTNLLREVINEIREDILISQKLYNKQLLKENIQKKLEGKCRSYDKADLKRVINATGIILHTNLGRATLCEEAIESIGIAARYYSNLEFDLVKNQRGSRHDLIENKLIMATGTEAAMVVNNNAAAVYLILKTLSSASEVIISKGELIEIGGSFRISTIMEESKAILSEVGTTNRTNISDYEKAITPETKIIMKVHTSNFDVVGYTSSVNDYDLGYLARKNGLIFYHDLGSGDFYDFEKVGIGHEPNILTSIKNADLISFSGDKLLGGPQAGIILGKKEIITELKNSNLSRVLRVDKLTLAALDATLRVYQRNKEEIPLVKWMLKSSEEIQKDSLVFKKSLKDSFIVEVISGKSKVGGGTMPTVELDTYNIVLTHSMFNVNELNKKLIDSEIPIITRKKNGKLIFDLRTVSKDEQEIIINTLNSID